MSEFDHVIMILKHPYSGTVSDTLMLEISVNRPARVYRWNQFVVGTHKIGYRPLICAKDITS